MRLIAVILFLIISSNAQAETKLSVVTSIKPIHSLVSGVMSGIGKPTLLLDGASSPHDFNLKPSQASLIQEADVVFWIGHSLEGFLEKPLETIGSKAMSVELIESPNITKLKFREGNGFDKHEHEDDHEDDHEDEHEHEHSSEHHDDEHGSEINPHIWLDPQNAMLMVGKISTALSKADKANESTYSKNAAAVIEKLKMLDQQITKEISPLKDQKFIVFHDAYPYFENCYGINASGSITINPENAPGAKRVKSLQEKIQTLNVTCIFSEPQFSEKLVKLVTQNTNAKTSILDPLGANVEAGENHYFDMMNNLSTSFADCLE